MDFNFDKTKARITQIGVIIPLCLIEEIMNLSGKKEKFIFRLTCKFFLNFFNTCYSRIIEDNIGREKGICDAYYVHSKFDNPVCLTGFKENVYVSDMGNKKIRKINTISKQVETINSIDNSLFKSPYGLAMDTINEILYISDMSTHSIKYMYLFNKEIHTLNLKWECDVANPSLDGPFQLALDVKNRDLYVSDFSCRLIKIYLDLPLGYNTKVCEKDLKVVIEGMTVNPITHELYVIENNSIYTYSPKTHLFTLLCGGNDGYKDGNFEKAEFNNPRYLYFDDGILYVADYNNNAIRKICFTTRMVSTMPFTVSKPTCIWIKKNQSRFRTFETQTFYITETQKNRIKEYVIFPII